MPKRYIFLNLVCQSTLPVVLSSHTLPFLLMKDTFILTFLFLPIAIEEYTPIPENEILAIDASSTIFSFGTVTVGVPNNWYLSHFRVSIIVFLFLRRALYPF